MADDKFEKEMSDAELDSIAGGRGIQELGHGRRLNPVGHGKGVKMQPAGDG